MSLMSRQSFCRTAGCSGSSSTASMRLRIGDEVGREEAAVELHPFDHLESGLGCLRFLDRDHAFAADLFHRVGDEFADGRVVVG